MKQLRFFTLILFLFFVPISACGSPAAEPAAPDPAPQVPTEAPQTEPTTAVITEQVDEPTPTPEPEPTSEPTAEPTEEPAPEPVVETGISPQAADGTVNIAAGHYIYSNANVVRGATIYNESLWTASPGGLVRYDLATGAEHKYTTLNGLPNIGVFDAITCPVEGEERLIIGARNGLFLYDADNDSFEDGTPLHFTEDFTARNLVCDRANNRLIFSHQGVTIIDLATGDRNSYDEDDGLAWFSISRIVLVGNDVWATTSSRGLSRISLAGDILTLSANDDTFPDNNIRDVTGDGNNTVWISANDGLFKLVGGDIVATFDRDSSAISTFGPSYLQIAPDGDLWLAYPSTICQFNEASGDCDTTYTLADMGLSGDARLADFKILADGRFLVYTNDHGAAILEGETWTSYALEDQAPGNFFDHFYQASDGAIWVLGSGLYYTDLDVTHWTQLPRVPAGAIAEDHEGTLWFTSGHRLVGYDGQQIVEYNRDDGMADLNHRSLMLHNWTQLYAGGERGYTVIDISGAEPLFTVVNEESGWDFGNIRDLVVYNNEVYAATTMGLAKLSDDNWEVVLDESYVNLPNRNIAALAVGLDGRLILGGPSGLAYFDGETVTPETAVTASVTDIAVSRQGDIWVSGFDSGTLLGAGGQPDGGVYHYDGTTWHHISFSDGLPMSSPRAILIDNANTVWIGFGDTGLGGGIYRIIP